MVKAALPPDGTTCGVAGLMLPFAPAVGVMVNVCWTKVALIVWLACTFVKV